MWQGPFKYHSLQCFCVFCKCQPMLCVVFYMCTCTSKEWAGVFMREGRYMIYFVGKNSFTQYKIKGNSLDPCAHFQAGRASPSKWNVNKYPPLCFLKLQYRFKNPSVLVNWKFSKFRNILFQSICTFWKHGPKFWKHLFWSQIGCCVKKNTILCCE